MVKLIKKFQWPNGFALALWHNHTPDKRNTVIEDLRNDLCYHEDGTVIMENTIWVAAVPFSQKILHLYQEKYGSGATINEVAKELGLGIRPSSIS